MEIVKGKVKRGRISVLYGPHGVGKTTFACEFPKPLVIDIENGCADLDVDRTPHITSYEDLIEALKWFYAEGGKEYKTLVIDSIDHAEMLIHRHVCKEAKVDALGDIEWGKGKQRAMKRFGDLLHMIALIRDMHGVEVVVIAHDDIRRVEDPEVQSYDRHEPKTIIRDASQLLCEWADEVLYAHHSVRVKSETGAFGKQSTRALERTERLLRSVYKPTAIAKNRLGMEDVIEFDFDTYAAFRSF